MKKQFTLLIPIYNLQLSNDINGEILIDNVIFISSKKISRVHQRLGINKPISYYQSKLQSKSSQLLSSSDTYACLHTSTNDDKNLTGEFKRLQDAVYLLASSQYYRRFRGEAILFGGPEFKSTLQDQVYVFEHNSDRFSFKIQAVNRTQSYRINKSAINNKYHFFNYLIKASGQNNSKINIKWQHTLRHAAILAGQSLFARNAWEAFLYVMIAIESLLTERGDKFPDAIITRLEGLFGWYSKMDADSFSSLIKDLYELRCKFVHSGDYRGITFYEVEQADMLLSNLLLNLWIKSVILCKKSL